MCRFTFIIPTVGTSQRGIYAFLLTNEMIYMYFLERNLLLEYMVNNHPDILQSTNKCTSACHFLCLTPFHLFLITQDTSTYVIKDVHYSLILFFHFLILQLSLFYSLPYVTHSADQKKCTCILVCYVLQNIEIWFQMKKLRVQIQNLETLKNADY